MKDNIEHVDLDYLFEFVKMLSTSDESMECVTSQHLARVHMVSFLHPFTL
jgi:hypothetical protein